MGNADLVLRDISVQIRGGACNILNTCKDPRSKFRLDFLRHYKSLQSVRRLRDLEYNTMPLVVGIPGQVNPEPYVLRIQIKGGSQ